MSHPHSHLPGHSHGHGSDARAGERHVHRLGIALALTGALAVVQAIGAIALQSLALASDTGHVVTDAFALGLGYSAVRIASNGERGGHRTFGLFRLEVLAALLNAVLLLAVAAFVLWEAVQRIGEPHDVSGWPLLGFAGVGLLVNVIALRVLAPGAHESLNVRSAQLEVLADIAGSLGVLVTAIVLATTHWDPIDTIAGAVIGLVIIPRALRLGAHALRILVQAAPAHLDVSHIERDLATIPGVIDVHDLHVWTLTSEMEVLTAHLMVRDADAHAVLDQARVLLRDHHGIGHATIQVEPDDHEGCTELDW